MKELFKITKTVLYSEVIFASLRIGILAALLKLTFMNEDSIKIPVYIIIGIILLLQCVRFYIVGRGVYKRDCQIKIVLENILNAIKNEEKYSFLFTPNFEDIEKIKLKSPFISKVVYNAFKTDEYRNECINIIRNINFKQIINTLQIAKGKEHYDSTKNIFYLSEQSFNTQNIMALIKMIVTVIIATCMQDKKYDKRHEQTARVLANIFINEIISQDRIRLVN